jgi:Ni/Co efflux regulator RcnB
MSLKLWIRAGAIATASLALSMTMAVAQGNGHGHDKHDRDDNHGRAHDRDDHGRGHAYGHEEHGRGHEHFRYVDRDRDLRGWYHEHYRHPPPGLAKRDRLPPGLERRLVVNEYVPVEARGYMHPCPREVEVMLPPPPPNFVHVVIGGNLVLYNRANFQIADVFQFNVN